MARQWQVGQGWDIHRLVKDRSLILGGVEIPFDLGLKGHSDADVLLHAIIDALLGATGDGDIGTHFPDSDRVWGGISSIKLLKSVHERIEANRWQIGNIDSTIIAEAPRLGPHLEAIKIKIAHSLAIDLEQVSVKAKTGEGLGPEGRGEAISAQAIVAIWRD